MADESALARARSAWGEDLPDWVHALAEEADRTSQGRTATRIGYSAAAVSGVLRRTYNGDLSAVEERVRAALMGAKVTCHGFGGEAIDKTDCLDWQTKARAWENTSPQRRVMYQACRSCPISRVAGREEGAKSCC